MASKNLAFKGFKELGEIFDALPKSLGTKEVRRILRKAAQPIVSRAKELSSNADVTGETTKSIGVINGRGAGRFTQVYVGPRRGGGFKGYIGHLLEYGTAPHIIRAATGKTLSIRGRFAKQVMHPGMAAQPFMRPAYDSMAPAAANIIKQECLAIIESGFKNIKF